MTMTDEQFEKLVKKSKRKRYNITIVVSIFTLLITISLLLGGYLFYYNLGPFQGEKIGGVPDGKLAVIDNTQNPLNLLVSESNGYAFNTEAEEISVFVDHYSNGKKQTHQLVANIGLEKRKACSGYIYWVIQPGKGENSLGKLIVGIESGTNESGTISSKNDFDLSALHINENNGLASSEGILEPKTLRLNRKYMLKTWTNGKTIYGSMKDNIKNTKTDTDTQLLVLYAQFN